MLFPISHSPCSHELMFERGDLTEPNMLNMEEYQDPDDAQQFIMEMTGSEPRNEPDNRVSPVISVQPFTQFSGVREMATISIDIDESAENGETTIYRASPQNQWSYAALDTQIINGKAVAQTDQGGVFVAAAQVSTGLIVGVVIAAVVLILVITVVIGVTIYFVTRPEKLKSTKEHLVKTQNRLKRSFAKQV